MESVFASFVVSQKGRTTLPATVRRQAGIVGDTEMVAHVVCPGRIMIETRAAVRARVWANAPEPSGFNTAQDIEALRSEDVLIADSAASERSTSVTSDRAIDQLLADLGL